MKNKRHLLIALVFVVCPGLFLLSCDDDDSKESEEQPISLASENLDSYVKSLQDPLQDPVGKGSLQEPEQIGDVLEEIDEDQNLYCECRKYKASATFDENMILDPQTGVIYPGAILDGNSISDGSYKQIVLNRAPLTISTNFMNIDTDCKTTVNNPVVSEVRSAIKKMLYDSNINGTTPAKMTFKVEQVRSQEDLSLAIGASFKMGSNKVSEKFNWANSTIKSRFLLKYNQVYYTIDVDAQKASDFFAPTVTAQEFKAAIGSNTTPVYVSSVSYGRVAYICIESTQEADVVKNVLDATVNCLSSNISVSTEFTKSSVSKSITYQGTYIGGSAEDAAKTVQGGAGLEDLIKNINEYIANGGNFSKSSPAEMIAYKLTKLSDNTVFSVNSGTEFVSRVCHSTNASIVPKYIWAVNGDGDPLYYGSIKASLGYKSGGSESSPYYLFNKSSDNRIKIGVGQKYTMQPTTDSPFKIDYKRLDQAYIKLEIDLWDWDNHSGDDGLGEYHQWNNNINMYTNSEDGRAVLYFELKDYEKKYANLLDADGNIVVLLRDFSSDSVLKFAFNINLDN